MIVPLLPRTGPTTLARSSLEYQFGQAEKAGVIITALCSVLSLCCVTVLLTHVIYMAIRPFLQRQFGICGGPQFLRVHFSVFIVCLFTSDLLQAVSGMIQIRWVQLGGINSDWACTMQGALLHVGNVGTAVWTTIVAIHTFISIVLAKELQRWVITAIVIVGWVIIALIGLIGPIFMRETSGFYGIAGSWCFVVDPFQRIVLHYIELFISAFMILMLYILVFLKLRGHLLVDGGRWSFSRKKLSDVRARSGASEVRLDSLAKKMLWYPIVYFTLIIPISICRLASFAGVAVPTGAWIFAMCLLFLMGTANALVYTLTRNMGFSNAWKPINKNFVSSSHSAVAMQIVVDKETTTDVKYLEPAPQPLGLSTQPPASRHETPLELHARVVEPQPLQARNPDSAREPSFYKEVPQPETPSKSVEASPHRPAVLKLPRPPSPVTTLFRESRVTLAPTRPGTPPPAYFDEATPGARGGVRISGSYPPEKRSSMLPQSRPSTATSIPPTPTLPRLSTDEKREPPPSPRREKTVITFPTPPGSSSGVRGSSSGSYPHEMRSGTRSPCRPSTSSSIPPTPTLPRLSADERREPLPSPRRDTPVMAFPMPPGSNGGVQGGSSSTTHETRSAMRSPRRPSTTSSIQPAPPLPSRPPIDGNRELASLSRDELRELLSTTPPQSRNIISNPSTSHYRSASSSSAYPSHSADSASALAPSPGAAVSGSSTQRHGSASAVLPSRQGRKTRPPHTAPSRTVGKSFLDLDMQ